MPSAKHNSTMERITGLISSPLDIASSRDVPFHCNCCRCNTCIMGLPLCSSSFCWQCKVLICNSAIWLPIGFVMLFSCIFWSDLDSLYRYFLHCCLFVRLCNKWSIATNEVQWPPHFSVCDWLQGHVLRLPCFLPSLSVVTGFMQRSIFLYVCNTV